MDQVPTVCQEKVESDTLSNTNSDHDWTAVPGEPSQMEEKSILHFANGVR